MILIVHGTPAGKGRPRFVRATGRAYSGDATVSAENAVRDAWDKSGQARLPDLALEMVVTLWLARPRAHYKQDGSLSAAGRRSDRPTRKPDLDNALKLVCDALNGLAYRDDVQIVDATARKLWCGSNQTPRTVIELYAADKHAAVEAAYGRAA